jgi:hypothetical protein
MRKDLIREIVVRGFSVQVSAQPLAAGAARLIESETKNESRPGVKRRMEKDEEETLLQ